MKAFKPAYFILAAGIFILIFNSLFGWSITSKYSETNGVYKTNKVSVNVLKGSASQERSAFTMDDIRHMQEFSFKDTDMAYSSAEKSAVSYKDSRTEAEVYGVNYKYGMFHQIEFKSGSFITEGNKDEKVAVVDENLAEKLFNNDNVVGMPIELYGQEFKIIGVIKGDESIVQAITDSGLGNIYIPVEQMLIYDENSEITSFEVKAGGNITGQNISKAKEALGSIGKNALDYKIIDYNLENILVSQKTRLCIFMAGMSAIIMLLYLIKKRAVDIYSIIKSGLKEDYFSDVLKLKCLMITMTMLEMVVIFVFIYLLWDNIKFSLYIPAEYVPNELIDIDFFSGLFKSLAQTKVQNAGYVPTYTEMKMNVLNIMQNWNACIGLLIGFPLYYLGLKLLELKEENCIKLLLYSCLCLISSIILGVLILLIFKMPVAVDIKGVSVVLAFIFLSIYRAAAHTQNRTIKI
ncbi:macrolide export ATP-binding/permease protein MacB [Oxobacter pfennigii]|uniref:Macrolide export ATP-binding/permease protein MacB n=1 Tax=Oxobacter pfennigii TaxID=36849 RepID=A0A0P8Z1Z2_9CLOT|nr:ABC transporter permease [Oxobacter pfennigii]KPU46145.1 macrolide export ATP-binding/permease protein MacB [Oxobacter pfennigii]